LKGKNAIVTALVKQKRGILTLMKNLKPGNRPFAMNAESLGICLSRLLQFSAQEAKNPLLLPTHREIHLETS
jgi:hypothetical protein